MARDDSVSDGRANRRRGNRGVGKPTNIGPLSPLSPLSFCRFAGHIYRMSSSDGIHLEGGRRPRTVLHAPPPCDPGAAAGRWRSISEPSLRLCVDEDERDDAGYFRNVDKTRREDIIEFDKDLGVLEWTFDGYLSTAVGTKEERVEIFHVH